VWKKLPDITKKDLQELRVSRKAKLYADEDIEDDVVEFLKESGVNITSARTLGHRGKPDSFHAALSFKEKRFLLTKNTKHYLDNRKVPFQMVYGIIAVDGDMGEMYSYTKTLLTILDLIPYGDSYVGMKIHVAKNELTLHFIDINGQLTTKRMRAEGEKVYEWVNGDQ
jgi:hypothetical protein